MVRREAIAGYEYDDERDVLMAPVLRREPLGEAVGNNAFGLPTRYLFGPIPIH